jgi:hypothetical protein
MWAQELVAQQALAGEALAMVINAVVDLEQKLVDSANQQLGQAEARFAERIRADVTGAGRQIVEILQTETADLRQIGNLLSRRAGRVTPRIRCIFLVHAIESWDAQIDLFHAMQNDQRFEPIVVSINRQFPGDTLYRGEEETSAALHDAGIPHIRLGMEPSWPALDILRALEPDVIFRQSQWEGDVPPAFATTRLNFARICSVPYGMSIVGKFLPQDISLGGVNAQSFDQIYHRMAWRVFCETEQTRNYFLQFGHSNPAKFVVSGYPKLTRLLRARDEPEVWPLGDPAGRRFRVIWAPHYSIGTDWLGFGVFDRIYRAFLEWARARPDIDFVLKPHPALFSFAVKGGAMSRQAIDDFRECWSALPNCSIELGAYAQLFAASDMMVTDGLSFLTEYPIFEKPLLFFDSGRHVPMNLLGDKALACAHHVTTFEEMRTAIEAYAGGGQWAYDEQRKALLATLFPCHGDPTDLILESIAEGFVTDRQEGL